MKYEYKTMEADNLVSEEQLNELGEEGWMLVAVVPFTPDYRPSSRLAFYLMRVKDAT